MHDAIGVKGNIFVMKIGDDFMKVTLSPALKKSLGFWQMGVFRRWNDNCTYNEAKMSKT